MKITPHTLEVYPTTEEAHQATRVLWTFLKCVNSPLRAKHLRTLMDDVFTEIGMQAHEDFLKKQAGHTP